MWTSVLSLAVGLLLTPILAGAQEPTSAEEQYGIWKQKAMSRPGNYENPSDQQFAAVLRRSEAGSAQADLGMVGLNNGFDIYAQPLVVRLTPDNEERCERAGEVMTDGARGAGDNKWKVTERRLTFPVGEGVNAVEIRVRLDTPGTESREMRLVIPLLAEAQFGLRRVMESEKRCEIVDGP